MYCLHDRSSDIPKVREHIVPRCSLEASCKDSLCPLSGHDGDLIGSHSKDWSKSVVSILVNVGIVVSVADTVQVFCNEDVSTGERRRPMN